MSKLLSYWIATLINYQFVIDDANVRSIFLLIIFFYWRIVDEQYTNLLHSKVTQLYMYTTKKRKHLYLLPLWFITRYWPSFPVLYIRTLFFICPIFNSLRLPTSNPQTIHLPPPPSFDNHTSVLCLGVCFYKTETDA